MNGLIFLFPPLLIVAGLWQLLSGESAWARYERRMRTRGIVNLERTSEWDRNRVWGGAFCVAGGVAMLFFLMAMGANSERQTTPSSEHSQWVVDGTPISPDEARGLGLPDK